MLPDELLKESRISLDDSVASKKKALERLAELLAEAGKPPAAAQIYEKLLERERLGSTGMSHGVAIPHARIAGLKQPRGAFLRLEHGVDFDALDGKPVDLLLGLLVPEEATDEHLALLAELASLFSGHRFSSGIRAAPGSEEVMHLFYPQALPDAASSHS